MTPGARRRIVELSTWLNPAITRVLRSRLHWPLSRSLMLITVTGRRSGRCYTIPVSYHRMEDCIVVLVAEARSKNWWRNYLTPGPVGMRLGSTEVAGVAETLAPGSPEFRRLLEASFRRSPFIPALFGTRFDAKTGLGAADLARLGAEAAVVKITTAVSGPGRAFKP